MMPSKRRQRANTTDIQKHAKGKPKQLSKPINQGNQRNTSRRSSSNGDSILTKTDSEGPTESIKFSLWWTLLCMVDIIITACTSHKALDIFLLAIKIQEGFADTYHQLWWSGIIRTALTVHMFYVIYFYNERSNESLASLHSKRTKLRYALYIHLCVLPVLLCHVVARLILDSENSLLDSIESPIEVIPETNASLTLTYSWLVGWHILCILIQTALTFSYLVHIPLDYQSKQEQRDRRGRLLINGVEGVGKGTFYKLFSWYKPHLKLILLGYVFLTAHSIVDAMLPYYKAKVIDVIKSDKPLEGLSQHVLGMVVLSIIGTVANTLWSSVTMMVRSGLHNRIRCRLFRWIVYQEISFFDKTKSGELTASLSSDAEALGGVLSRLDSVIKTMTRIIGMVVFMTQLSWQLTLVVVLGTSILVVTTHFYGKYTKSIHKQSQECRRAANAVAQEVLSAMRTVRAFGSEEEEIKRYSDRCQEQYDLQLIEAWLSPSYSALDSLLHMSVMAGTIFYGGHLVVKERITSGDLVSFILYLTKLGTAMSSLLNMYQWLMRMLGASDKVFKYLDADPVTPPDGTVAPEHLNGRIEMKNVNFAYPTRPDMNVLKNLSLTVEAGEVVAMVGPSGAGKSSVFNLLQRLYTPTSGQITLDAEPLANYKHSYLRSKMAIVSQEPTLFARSIRDNIRYGLGSANISADDISTATEDANAASFINKFPEGIETYVGEKGMQLSGGQKQRVAIARALIRKPSILLLDEATSALDTESEKKVQAALHRTVGGRTVLILAHRLSTVRRADRILVLNRGSIVEEGTHETLLEKQALYYNLVRCQLLKGVT